MEERWEVAQRARRVVGSAAEAWRLAGRGEWERAAAVTQEAESELSTLLAMHGVEDSGNKSIVLQMLPLLQAQSGVADGRLRLAVF